MSEMHLFNTSDLKCTISALLQKGAIPASQFFRINQTISPLYLTWHFHFQCLITYQNTPLSSCVIWFFNIYLFRDSLQLNLNGNVFQTPTIQRSNFSSYTTLEHLYLSECGIENIEVPQYTFIWHFLFEKIYQ